MKAGDLVSLCPNSYPQYRGKFGLLINEVDPDQWKVYIQGRLHPYKVHSVSMRALATVPQPSDHWDGDYQLPF